MLTGDDLWFRYGRREPWVLAGAGIAVAPGEVVGLWGPSGCGKSTLGSALAGLRQPHRGTVTLDGEPLASYDGARPVQLVLQHAARAMNPRWRIAAVLGEAAPGVPVAADELVDAAWLDRFPHELSGGEQQRVNLARALRARPRFLVADEISASLDALTQAVLWRHLRARVDEGLGVLAISHDRALLDAVADRTVDLAPAPVPGSGLVGAGTSA